MAIPEGLPEDSDELPSQELPSRRRGYDFIGNAIRYRRACIGRPLLGSFVKHVAASSNQAPGRFGFEAKESGREQRPATQSE